MYSVLNVIGVIFRTLFSKQKKEKMDEGCLQKHLICINALIRECQKNANLFGRGIMICIFCKLKLFYYRGNFLLSLVMGHFKSKIFFTVYTDSCSSAFKFEELDVNKSEAKKYCKIMY